MRYQLDHRRTGVAEVASVGGFVKTYQVTVDPRKLQAYGHSADTVAASHPRQQPRRGRARDRDGGDRIHGARPGLSARHQRISRISWSRRKSGMPVLMRDIARVELAPDERRGIAELNGEGEVVSGIAVARYGENALDVIRQRQEQD